MWQRFTEKARAAVFAAQKEAQQRHTAYVNSEHLLLGLLAEEGNVACRILKSMNISLETLRAAVDKQDNVAPKTIREAFEKQAGARKAASPATNADMQLTPRSKRIIDLAYDEARQLSNSYIGTEHLLLGLIREGEGLAGRVLAQNGVELERTRREVMALQDNDSGIATQGATAPASQPAPPAPDSLATAARLSRASVSSSTLRAAEILFNNAYAKLTPEQQQALQNEGLLLSELPPAFAVILKVATEAWDTQEAVVLSRNSRLRVQQTEFAGKYFYTLQTDVSLITTLLVNTK